MLVLSRRSKEKISFPELGITVNFLRIQAGAVKVGVEAPPAIKIVRDELAHQGVQAEQTRKLLSRLPQQARHDIRNELHSISIGLHLYQEQMRIGADEDARETFQEVTAAVRRLDGNEYLSRPDRSAAEGNALLERIQQLRPESQVSQSGDRTIEGRILLAEDDSNEREMLAGFLRLGGLQVDAVSDGEQAVDYLAKSETPDLLLLDMKMPHRDGPGVVKFVRSSPQFNTLPIFGISGSSAEENQVPIGNQGVNRWISKPLNPPAFLQAVSEAISA